MNLAFDKKIADEYTSQSQKIRILTEDWVDRQIYCPNCGYLDIYKYANNQPVADFFCSNCKEDYELKSKKENIGNKIVDGAYRTMIERLQSNNNPNFFLLNYDLHSLDVLDFIVIPKHFLFLKLLRSENRFRLQRAEPVGLVAIFFCKVFRNQERYFLLKIGKLSQSKKCLLNGKKRCFCAKKKRYPQRVGCSML